jgi:histidinol dehydrogenase
MNVRRMTTTQDTDPILPTGLKRVSPSAPEAEAVAREIIAAVRARGDDAVCEFTARFDDVRLAPEALRVPADAMKRAADAVDDDVRDALVHAIANIRKFHQTQMPDALALTEVEPGVWCGDRWTPLDTVCLYVPRGRGAFASVMCMLGAPAKIAGVGRIIVCTPPGPDGAVDPATLLAARVLGIDEIYRVGGAQAVAAVALGTEKIPRCDKIVGPGNVFVSAARTLLADTLDPGPPAGPSESAILCVGAVDCRNAAWNLLVEAEHGENSCALLVSEDAATADGVVRLLPELAAELPPQRREFATAVLENNGGIVVTDGVDTSIAVVNAFAPEHLAVMTDDPWTLLPRIRHAGEILMGDYPIISLGNYAMGVNAILPTGGAARTRSCVSVQDFLKRSSVGFVTRTGFDKLRPVVSTLSRDEGFSAHHLAVEQWNAPANAGDCGT